MTPDEWRKSKELLAVKGIDIMTEAKKTRRKLRKKAAKHVKT